MQIVALAIKCFREWTLLGRDDKYQPWTDGPSGIWVSLRYEDGEMVNIHVVRILLPSSTETSDLKSSA